VVSKLKEIEDISVSKFWKWKCEQCGHEFSLTLAEMPQPCHRCDGEWFLKVGESDTKDQKPTTTW
jgi:DNA-directed RNA polymerase subunit RPC12/RpoP